ncbi:MAG: DUF4350 domain-containing protein [Deltaproteobacteria bacterium]|nr:DUF4350 domain-containing protein [Deltaproteobacteria bacterium]
MLPRRLVCAEADPTLAKHSRRQTRRDPRLPALVWSVTGLLALAATIPQTTRSQTISPRIQFDAAHGEKFTIANHDKLDLSELAKLLRAGGAEGVSANGEINDIRLAGVSGLVLSGAFAPPTPAEIDSIVRFLSRGGRLAVMLHVPFPVAPLLNRLHVDFSNGVIHERENLVAEDPLNFRVTALTKHPLTRGLDSFSAFGVWALLNQDPNGVTIARSSDSSWVDLNGDNKFGAGDAVQSFSVAVAGELGEGRFVVFGDDAIFQNQFMSDGNVVLAKNLGCWLAKAECK